MTSAGMVLVTEFSDNHKSDFTGYVDYIDRPDAVNKEQAKEYARFSGYTDYMDDPEKSTGLFTKDQDFLSEEQKEELKEVYALAGSRGSLLWQSVLSFDNTWLSQMGIYDSSEKRLDEKRLKTAVRSSMGKLLEKEKLQNALWSASIHYNTDNLHVHIATVEPTPMRQQKEYVQYEKEKIDGKWQYKKEWNEKSKRYEKIPLLDAEGNIKRETEYVGKFQQGSIDAAKREFVKEISLHKEINSEINSLIRDTILGQRKEKNLLQDKDFRKDLFALYEKLPEVVSWNLWAYNANIMEPLKKEIDGISKRYIETYHQDDFRRLEGILEGQEKVYQAAYGKSNDFKQNKVDDLYARLGNSILAELKAYDREISRSRDLPDGQGTAHTGKKGSRGTATGAAGREERKALFHLRRSLRNNFEHWKNQIEYEQLQREISKDKDVQLPESPEM
jgi:hypothetical protein